VQRVTGFMLIDAALHDEAGAWRSALRHLLLPALVLGTSTTAVIARMTRSSLLEVLREDYMRSARARGLSPARVVLVHGLRNALIPVITVIGLKIGSLLAGAVLTETIFSWPGIGKWLIDAIARRDYPVVQAGILISACTFIAVNLLVDLLYGVVNPRIRKQG
jgi:dipeptide transport system permease protein